MKIHVECYSGYRADESPRVIRIGDNRIAVSEVLDRWIAPDHRYYKCRGEDDGIYIIRHDVETMAWELTFFRSADGMGGPPSGGSCVRC